MKIITTTKRNGQQCYVQVKDLLFLAKHINNKALMQEYLKAINNGKTDDEFIKVSGDSYIKAFQLCDYIVDFSEYSSHNIGIDYLSNMIKTEVYAVPKDKKVEEGIEHQVDAIRDIILYKRGELDYKIPLVPDGKVELLSTTNKYTFDSTIIDGCFILKTIDDSGIEKLDYENFLDNCIEKIFNDLYSGCNEPNYSTFIIGKTLVISVKKFDDKNKKNKVGHLLAKTKKEKQ